MQFKPYGKKKGLDLWFRIKFRRRGDCDREALDFCRNKGEFSLDTEIAFQKHIDKLSELMHDPFFNKYNGKKTKEICKVSPLWY